MKKIFLIILLFCSLITLNTVYSSCEYTEWAYVSKNLNDCFDSDSTVVAPKPKLVRTWLKSVINDWITRIAVFLSVMAVWWIVYWSFMLSISTWEDEKIKKWKDIVKWSIIWFLAVISAWWLISILISLIYSFDK